MARRNGGFIGTDGLDAPDPPTGVAASGVGQLSVSFTAPTDTGTSAITGFRAQASGVGTSGTSSPLVITGLTGGTEVSVSVWAINAYGYSAPSAALLATPAAGRAHFSGGENASGTLLNVKEIITTSSTGNSTDFGDLVTPTRRSAAFSSSTRGVIAGGRNGVHNVIQYFSIASSGDSLDFGDILSVLESLAGLSNSTRGIAAGGSSETNVIQFVTIATTGNATDFGDLSEARSTAGGLASTTRGVVCGGILSGAEKDIMEYVTIASAGNVTDFGNLSQAKAYIEGGCTSNSTRGLIMGGSRGSNDTVDEVEYITISSTGNVTDFGNLSAARMKGAAATTDDRAVIGGGQGDNTSDAVNIIEFFTITSTGNATDFGDLSGTQTELQGVSNSHGGL